MIIMADFKDNQAVEDTIHNIVECLKYGNKLLVFGNGGSASQADHFVAELVGAYMMRARKPINALSLNCNTAVMTAIANDYGYEEVFSRQVEAHGKPNDMAIGISTSGTSENVIRGLHKARGLSIMTVGLVGNMPLDKNTPFLAPCSILITTSSCFTDEIQEEHIQILHYIAGQVEAALTYNKQ